LNASNNDDITFAIKKKITVIKFCSLWQEKQVSLKCPANIASVRDITWMPAGRELQDDCSGHYEVFHAG